MRGNLYGLLSKLEKRKKKVTCSDIIITFDTLLFKQSTDPGLAYQHADLQSHTCLRW